MSATRIISVLLFLALTACGTDRSYPEYYYQILNSTDTTITVRFNRGGVDIKALTLAVNDTLLACQGSALEGDRPSFYDYAFVHYKDNVFIDSLKNESNSLLGTDNYIEYKKELKKGINHVFNLFIINSEYIDARSK
jgi:hypothetical protein